MQHIDNWQAMTLPNLEVQCVVRGGDFQNASTELRIDRFVGDDGDLFSSERTPRIFAQKVEVSLVGWMKSHGGIRHDCFWPCGCDFEKATGLFHDFVANKIKISFLRFGNDLLIRKRSLRSRVPIDHPATAIDQTLAVKTDKKLLDGSGISLVKRIALARPIA